MPQVRDVPRHVEIAHFDGRFLDDLARGGLARFEGKNQGRQGPGLGLRVRLADLRGDFLRGDVAGDDEKDIVGHILFAVIARDVVRLERIENIRVADDGEAVGTLGVGRFEQAPSGAPARIVLVHVHLAADNVQFPVQFVGRQGGVAHDVTQDINGGFGAGIGHIDMIDGAVEGSEGVHIAACRLDFLVNAAAGTGGGALEEHVLQHVGQPRPEPCALRNAAGAAPGLGGNDRRAMVLADDDHQAIVQRQQTRARRHGRNFGRGRVCLAVEAPPLFCWTIFHL